MANTVPVPQAHVPAAANARLRWPLAMQGSRTRAAPQSARTASETQKMPAKAAVN